LLWPDKIQEVVCTSVCQEFPRSPISTECVTYLLEIGEAFILCGFVRYFEDDDDDQKTLAELEYQPAPGSPTLDRMNAAAANQKDDDDSSSVSSDDPLDSFMADIEASSTLSTTITLGEV